MRLDDAAGDDLAHSSRAVHALDAQPDVAVVDEDLVAGLEHRAEDVRRDGEIVRAAEVLPGDDDGRARLELGGGLEVADPDLRALEVGDQRERATRLRLDGASATSAQSRARRARRARS